MGPVRVPPVQDIGRLGAGRALARAMLNAGTTGPVLFACADAHRDELPVQLRERGVIVDEVVCYRSLLAEESEARTAAALGGVLIVASPRVASLLARVCPEAARPELLAVGPTTAESARAAGWRPALVASEPTAGALASAVRSLLTQR
jgi:uroporphyrinogen-III synthase